MATIKVFPDIYKLSRVAAEFFATISKKTIREQGRFSVALSGGATPESLYALLATDAFSSRVDWANVHIFWSDERCVHPKHTDSNYRMAQYALLSGVPIPDSNIHRIKGEMKPAEATADYNHQLKDYFGPEVAWPRFDLIFLGMGDDGHTASLFPYTDTLTVFDQWAATSFAENLSSWRVTLTIPSINAAANIVVMVTGQAKAKRLHEVLEGQRYIQKMPIQAIEPVNGKKVWLLDEAAASLLTLSQGDED